MEKRPLTATITTNGNHHDDYEDNKILPTFNALQTKE